MPGENNRDDEILHEQFSEHREVLEAIAALGGKLGEDAQVVLEALEEND